MSGNTEVTAKETKKVGVVITAADLIMAAAKDSGLLDEVTAALCFFETYRSRQIWNHICPERELRDVLTDAFDEHIGIPHGVIEYNFGKDAPDDLSGMFTAEELAPYLT